MGLVGSLAMELRVDSCCTVDKMGLLRLVLLVDMDNLVILAAAAQSDHRLVGFLVDKQVCLALTVHPLQEKSALAIL